MNKLPAYTFADPALYIHSMYCTPESWRYESMSRGSLVWNVVLGRVEDRVETSIEDFIQSIHARI